MQLKNSDLLVKHAVRVFETDENGKFEVEVELLADKSVNKRYSPSYLYQITADVTDINGETRSTTQSISVGYASLKISLGVPAELSINQENKFSLSTTNHSGEKIPTKGKINEQVRCSLNTFR